MKKSLAIAAVLAATTGTAAAESDAPVATRSTPGYLALGGNAGLESVAYLGFAIDGGFRLGDSPLYLRGQVSRGVAAQVFSDGTYQSYRAGLEARGCDRRVGGCLFGGIDGGLRRAQLTDNGFHGDGTMEERLADPIVVPRVGYEIGSRVIFRIGVELPIAIREDEALVGFGVTTGIGYRF